MGVDAQNDQLVHACDVLAHLSGKIMTQQLLRLRPTIFAQFCGIVAKSEKKIMFGLVTYRQGSIETSHNLRFTCEMLLHQFFMRAIRNGNWSGPQLTARYQQSEISRWSESMASWPRRSGKSLRLNDRTISRAIEKPFLIKL